MSGISRRLFGVMAVAALGCLISGTHVRAADPAPAPTTTPSIAGVVTAMVNGTATPVADAAVKLMPPKSAAPADAGAKHKHAKPLQETTTDSNGKYSFSNVDPGSYVVVATLKGTGTGHADATVTAGATATVDITLAAHEKKQK